MIFKPSYLWLCFILPFGAYALPKVDLKYTYIDNHIIFYVSNHNYCPVGLVLKFKNAEILQENIVSPFVQLVSPDTDSIFICKLTFKQASTRELSYNYKFIIGDASKCEPDYEWVYTLPYDTHTSHFVAQGYNGKFSHKGEYALDFFMKIGTPIYASRAGIVVDTKSDSKEHGKGENFGDKANYIKIYHSDGTNANYYHLNYDGVKVNIGDTVQVGEHIGYSGNTGWSTGPHLHFEVRRPLAQAFETIPTFFKQKNGKVKKIKAWHWYRAYR